MNEKKPNTPKSASGNEGAHQQSEAPESHQQTMVKQKSNAGNINNAALQTVQAEPVQQAVPVQPTQQTAPVQPVQQTAPVQPVQQTAPVQPTQQAVPVQPTQQAAPVQPTQQAAPVQPTQQTAPVQPTQQVVQTPVTPQIFRTQSLVVLDATTEVINEMCRLSQQGFDIPVYLIVCNIVSTLNRYVKYENALRGKGAQNKLKYYTDIPSQSIAMLLLRRGDIVRIAEPDIELTSENKHMLPLAIYNTGYNPVTRRNYGIYEIISDINGEFSSLVSAYKPNISDKEKREIYCTLRNEARIVMRTVVAHLVPVMNGIYDMKKHLLIPYSPEYVFTSKIHTNFNPAAKNPVFHIEEDNSDWDVDTWLSELGDEEFVQSIMEVIQAACTPLVPRDQAVLFYATSGCNSKGTICKLIREIIGKDYVATIALEEFSKEFALAPLARAVAIISDESCVSGTILNAAKLKSVITGDSIHINIKYEQGFDICFHGLVLQCLNAFPKFGDKTDSMKRRLFIVPFQKTFTGKAKKYIKDDLITRTEVKEYILKRVLEMPLRYSFTPTAASQQLLRQYDIVSDSVAGFLEEIFPQLKWDLLPATDLLYVLYKQWYKRVNASDRAAGRNEFIESMRNRIENDHVLKLQWEWTDSARSSTYLNRAKGYPEEPLLKEYSILTMLRCDEGSEKFKEKYSGFVRKVRTYGPGIYHRKKGTVAAAASAASDTDKDGSQASIG